MRYNRLMIKNWKTSQHFIGWFLGICSIIGLLASFTLLHETFAVAKNPSYVPSCSINPFISCTGAMKSAQASAILGIPNPAFGIAAFTALLVFAVLLLAGTKIPSVIWKAGIVVALIGLCSSVHLYFVSILTLGTICPWCFATWIITIATSWVIITHSFATNQLTLSGRFKKWSTGWVNYAGLILAIVYALMIFGILVRFSEVLFT